MPIKTEVVPVPTEDGETASGQAETEKEKEEPKRPPKEQIPKAQAKRVSKKAVPQEAAEVPAPEVPIEETPQPKSKAKGKAKASAKRAVGGGEGKVAPKTKETADLSQKTKCSICKRVVTTHCLIYTHKCRKAALDEKKPMPTLDPLPEPPPEPPKLERASASVRSRDMKQWVEEHPGETFPHKEELPIPETFAPPPTFVETEGGGYLTIAERRVHHREALEQQYREYQLHKKQNQISHLRHFYG